MLHCTFPQGYFNLLRANHTYYNHSTICFDSSSLLWEMHVRKGNDAENSAIRKFLVVFLRLNVEKVSRKYTYFSRTTG